MNKAKIILIAVLTAMVILVGYNVFLVEYKKAEARRQAEEIARIEKEMLDKIKSWEAREIAEFDLDYRKIENEFIEEAGELSDKVEFRVSSIGELEELTRQRMNASKEFEDGLSRMDIPRPLGDYYKFEMEFLARDIEAMALVLEYYNSGNYSAYNDDRLDKAYRESSLWFRAAEEEMERVYSEYGLEHLLES